MGVRPGPFAGRGLSRPPRSHKGAAVQRRSLWERGAREEAGLDTQ